jgi:hypothetical protein
MWVYILDTEFSVIAQITIVFLTGDAHACKECLHMALKAQINCMSTLLKLHGDNSYFAAPSLSPYLTSMTSCDFPVTEEETT